MSDFNVNSKVFNIPEPGKQPNWAKDIYGWIKEVSAVIASLAGIGTITETQSIVENGVPSNSVRPIAGLAFNAGLTTSASIAYRIYRKTENTSAVKEQGIIHVNYTNANPLQPWELQRDIINGGPSFIYIDIDAQGQLHYWSTLIANNSPTPDSNYEGYIRFKTTNIIK